MRAAGCPRQHRLVDGAVVVQGLVAATVLQDEDRRSVEQRLGAEHRLAQLVQERIGHQRDERLGLRHDRLDLAQTATEELQLEPLGLVGVGLHLQQEAVHERRIGAPFHDRVAPLLELRDGVLDEVGRRVGHGPPCTPDAETVSLEAHPNATHCDTAALSTPRTARRPVPANPGSHPNGAWVTQQPQPHPVNRKV